MPHLCSFEQCTGCEACYNICPKNAIEILPQGDFGHTHPVINHEKCIECKLCESVCPRLHNEDFNIAKNAYAVWAKNESIHIKSSSGGVASALSIAVLKAGWNVFGCAAIGTDIYHLELDNPDDYALIQGSKYLQSRINLIYRTVKTRLREEKNVLFFGTPCQVSGLKHFLKKQYDNLVTIDLICHGCPSQNLFKEHLKGITDQPIEKISFRDEKGFNLKLVSEGKEIYNIKPWENRYGDAYFSSFLKGYTYRESCYKCPYARKERVSDITIGDFWGISSNCGISKDVINQGLSVVLCNTDSGYNFFQKHADEFTIVERPLSEAVKGNPQLMHPKEKTYNVKKFRWIYSFTHSLKTSLRLTDWYLIPLYSIKEWIKK